MKSKVPVSERDHDRAVLANELLECAKYAKCALCPHSRGDAREFCSRDVPVRAAALGMWKR